MMGRFFILFGYTVLFWVLYLFGNLNKYINLKYTYLSLAAIIGFSLLTIVQYILWLRDEKKKEAEQGGCLDGHSHEHPQPNSQSGKWKSLLLNIVLIIPVLTGIFIPAATMDSNIIKAKGFHFPKPEEEDPYGQHQFLRPDISVFYGDDGYEEVKKKELASFKDLKVIKLDDANYLKGLETLYNFPDQFMDKEIELDAFIYNDEDSRSVFAFRFGLIHCVADSGVFGMLIDMPKEVHLENDHWVHVKGKFSTILYQPFKTTIPYLEVDSWSSIPKPKEEYVYRYN
jgi:putative membrane protein